MMFILFKVFFFLKISIRTFLHLCTTLHHRRRSCVYWRVKGSNRLQR